MTRLLKWGGVAALVLLGLGMLGGLVAAYVQGPWWGAMLASGVCIIAFGFVALLVTEGRP